MGVTDKFIQSFGAGQSVFEAGAKGDKMYVVQAGAVEIFRQDGDAAVPLARLEEGEIFGEMALVDSGLRSATARAGAEGASLVCIDQARFVYLVSQQPAFALCVMRIMAKRLAGSAAQAH